MYPISKSKLRAFNKKHGLKLVNTSQRLSMTVAENKAYDDFVEMVFEPPGMAVTRAKRAVQENSGKPEYQLILIGAYLIGDKQIAARKLQDQLILDYPNYFLGIVSGILNTGDEARILALGEQLGPNLSIMDWPDNVEGGHGIFNFVQYEMAVAKYQVIKQAYKAAEARLERLLELGEPEEELAELIQLIVINELKENMGRLDKENKNKINVAEKITTGRPQRKVPSPLKLPELEALRRKNAEELTDEEIDALMALPREQAVADLRTGMMDFVDLIELPKTFRSFPFSYTGLVAFWRLLTAYEEVDSLPLMLDALRLDFENLTFYVDEIGEELLVPGLTMLGRKRPDLLEDYLLEPHNSAYCRAYVSDAMLQIGLHFPEQYEEMGQRLLAVLRYHLEHQDEKGTFDTTFISLLILNLVDLRYATAMPLIEQCFEQQIIETFTCGSLENLRKEIGFSTDSSSRQHLPENSYEYFRRFEAYIPKPNSELSVGSLLRGNLENSSTTRVTALKTKRQLEIIAEIFEMPEADDFEPGDFFDEAEVVQHPGTIMRSQKKVGRNDPCPCGSGKKYKKCCL